MQQPLTPDNKTVQIHVDVEASKIIIKFDFGWPLNATLNEDLKARTKKAGYDCDWDRNIWVVNASEIGATEVLVFAEAAKTHGVRVVGDDILTQMIKNLEAHSRIGQTGIDAATIRGQQFADDLLRES